LHLFGEVVDGTMVLNDFGNIAHQEWMRTPSVRPNTDLGAFIIMPDHVHGIIMIREDVTTDRDCTCRGGCNTPRSIQSSQFQQSSQFHHYSKLPITTPQSFLSPSQTVGAIIRGYMGAVTRQINAIRNTSGEKVWQRNYHDHIIRNKWAYYRITNYIHKNPLNYKG
jgi:REP element-mobilizing transposase RayT